MLKILVMFQLIQLQWVICLFVMEMLFSHLGIALDPRFKLNPYQDNLFKYNRAKNMLIAAVGFER